MLDDQMIQELLALSGGKNITDSLRIAIKDWIRKEKLRRLADSISKHPLDFNESFTAEEIRNSNR